MNLLALARQLDFNNKPGELAAYSAFLAASWCYVGYRLGKRHITINVVDKRFD